MKKIIASSILLGLAFVGTQAHAQEGICATPGTAMFQNIAETRDNILPTVKKELSGLGRLAKVNGCSIELTCVVDLSVGDDAKKIRDRKCSAARSALVGFERRSAQRKALSASYKMSKVNPNAQWQAGVVYISLK